MDWGTMRLDSAVSILVGVLSLVVAAIQTARLNRLRKLQIHRLRQDIVKCRQAIVESDRLSRRQDEYGINHPAAIGKIRSIHSNACNLVHSLFEQLSEVDSPYDADKLKQYVKLNLITSKWFWQQAALYVENPTNLEMPSDLPDNTPDYMEGVSGHPEISGMTLREESVSGSASNPGLNRKDTTLSHGPAG
jgi:hypothetical protein